MIEWFDIINATDNGAGGGIQKESVSGITTYADYVENVWTYDGTEYKPPNKMCIHDSWAQDRELVVKDQTTYSVGSRHRTQVEGSIRQEDKKLKYVEAEEFFQLDSKGDDVAPPVTKKTEATEGSDFDQYTQDAMSEDVAQELECQERKAKLAEPTAKGTVIAGIQLGK
ncbi:hypothetical protein BBJ29_008785 [Phytophthora kernoviae]|uniref:Uncharacterized protein n=1 Tax=Phytophthora kernoviae TaxID=325452 RepID=A0A3F2RB99_9STRA|nr:hypothetical protein BBP00_00009892 [Phytophthora kernoviae]RLN66004.1 hypothetical protein BBJ29_008785 [Phytophthora kernoviae]